MGLGDCILIFYYILSEIIINIINYNYDFLY